MTFDPLGLIFQFYLNHSSYFGVKNYFLKIKALKLFNYWEIREADITGVCQKNKKGYVTVYWHGGRRHREHICEEQ